MWAATCLPVGVPVPSTTTNPAAMCLPINIPAPFTATKPAVNRLSTGFPKKFQLQSQLRNLNLGYAAEQNRNNKSQTKHIEERGAAEEQVEDSNDKEKKLSGFDVLRALEKATAQKTKKMRNGRDNSSLLSRKVSGQGKKGTAEGDEAMVDYGNKIVVPLSMKEDWGTRLDELQTRLEQLVDTATA